MSDRDELLALVEELEQEAESAELDDRARKRLVELAERLRRRALLPPGAEDPEEPQIEDALEGAVAQFEVSHPRLSAAVDNISRLLSSLGI